MPELPEVETVRRTLLEHIVGQKVVRISLRRRSIVHGQAGAGPLLGGQTIARLERHGKQLAIVATGGPGGPGVGLCICVGLGMTGSLRFMAQARLGQNDRHCHMIWKLAGGGILVFRDPRRFGGLWTFPSYAALRQSRWAKLGPDALVIKPRELHQRFSHTSRPIKAALLDQNLLAGLGNIYVDELLHRCGIHPGCCARQPGLEQVQTMVRKMRHLLGQAIVAGGSSTRDYVDGGGRSGSFQHQHRVYSRSGQPCRNCDTSLVSTQIAGRTTVLCPRCQPLVTNTKKE